MNIIDIISAKNDSKALTFEEINFVINGYLDGSIDEDETDNKHLVIGFDRNVNPIEVMYNVIDENTINVFHAMRCRKNFLHLIKTRGENDG